MRHKRLKALSAICTLVLATLLTTSCDREFYLSEKESYALRSQMATQNVANQVFANVRGQVLQISFDNSVSPPRVRSSNLEQFLRNSLPTLGILEGYPSNALRIDRVSGEIEKQLDNWLASELLLYSGANNADVTLERVDAMRIMFIDNPAFTYSENRIGFTGTMQMTIDCRVKIDALDPITNFLAGGVNGVYDWSVTVDNLRIPGEMSFASITADASDLRFRLSPAPGNVVIRDRNTTRTSARVRARASAFIKNALSTKIEENFKQRYDHFALNDCRISTEFTCNYDQRPASSTPELHAVARGTDDRLYAAVRRESVWSNYNVIDARRPTSRRMTTAITFASDPAVAVSGPATVELAAVTSTGGLFYSQYQNGWKGFNTLAPVILPGSGVDRLWHYGGKPAIVATAPGQVEVIVARNNGSLIHLRRKNGVWLAPVVLNLPYLNEVPLIPISYSEPVAVRSGNKLVLAAKANGHMIYCMVYDLETELWSQHSQLQIRERVMFAPTLAASGDGQVELVYVGQGGTPYHRRLSIGHDNIRPNVLESGFSIGPDTSIGGRVSGAPLLAASGYRQLALVARGTDNRLYCNHFAGPSSPTGFVDGRTLTTGWSGWGTLNGNFYGTRLFANEYTEEFALSATRTGKLDIVARLRANTPRTAYTLHHNGFDANTWGRKPWKTVHWRGYDKIGDRQFNGRPAVAALDENYEIAFVGQNSNIHNAQNTGDFVRQTSFQPLASPAPVGPAMVSSGKGLLDFIAVGRDRKIKHLRSRNGSPASPLLELPGQADLTFQSQPAAVGYGDGQLDVIGVSTAGSIYYWRYLGGAWQNVRQVAGFVRSAPVLVDTGSGQLELFAVGGDNKIYRWRFLGGAWGNWQQVPSPFMIDAAKFGPGSATTWGDGTVDLAVIDNSIIISAVGAPVYQRHVEPRDDTVSLPGQSAQAFRRLDVSGGDRAFMAAFNRSEKFVIVTNSLSFHFNFAWIDASGVWKAGQVLNGSRMQIGGITQQPHGAAVVASDLTGRVYLHDRFFAADPRSDFVPLPNQAAQSRLRSSLYRPSIVSYAGQ
jgi:hypothetical protein